MKNNLNIELVMGLTGSGKTEYIKSKVNRRKANLICYKNLKANYSKNFNFIDINEYTEDKFLSLQNKIIVIDDFEELENKDYLINILNSLYKNKKEIFIKNKWYISLKSHEILNKIPWLSKYLVKI